MTCLSEHFGEDHLSGYAKIEFKKRKQNKKIKRSAGKNIRMTIKISTRYNRGRYLEKPRP